MIGDFGYWRLIPGAPSGSVAARASALLKMWENGRVGELLPDAPAEKAKDVCRSMALELAVASWSEQGGIPGSVSDLLTACCPRWAGVLIDPPFAYSGEAAGEGVGRQPAWRKLKNICMHLDIREGREKGRPMPATKLADELIKIVDSDESLRRIIGGRWGEAPALERSIRRWKKEPDYREALETAAAMHAEGIEPPR